MAESKGQAGGVLTPVAWMRPGAIGEDAVFVAPATYARLSAAARSHFEPLFTRPTPAAAADLRDALERVCSHKPRTHAQIDADWDNARTVLAASPAAAAGVPTDKGTEVLRNIMLGEVERRIERLEAEVKKQTELAALYLGWYHAAIAVSPVALAGAPTEKEIEILAAEHLRAETGADGIGRTCAWVTGVQTFARALLSYPAAPQSSVASPAPRSSLRAVKGSELPREPSGEPSGEQPINETEAAAVPLHNLKRQNMTTITHQLTDGSIGSDISSEHYFNGGDGIYGAARKAGDESVQAFPAALDSITFCVLVLHDGSTVTGESVCTNPENFDADREKKIAHDCAAAKMVAP